MPYKTESDMRQMALIRPDEQMPDGTTPEESLARVQAELNRTTNPRARAVLQQEYERQQREGPPTGFTTADASDFKGAVKASDVQDKAPPAAPAPDWTDFLPGGKGQTPGGAAPHGGGGDWTDYLPKPQDAGPPPEGAFSRAARVAQDPEGGLLAAGGSLIDSAMNGPNGAPSKTRGLGDAAADLGRSFTQGAIDVGSGALGLASLATGGFIGDVARKYGWDPQTAQAMIQGYKSEPTQQADQNIAQAKGLFESAKAAVLNPTGAIDGFVQAVPGMLAAMATGGAAAAGVAGSTGLFARVVMPYAAEAAAAAGLTGEAATAFTGQYMAGVAKAAATAGAFGAQTAGSVTNAGQDASQDWTTYAPAALASGLATVATVLAGGQVSKAMGTSDLFTGTAATATRSRLLNAGVETAKQAVENAAMGAEGKIGENVASGKPWGEDVGSAMGSGAVVGGAMGLIHGAMHTPPVKAPTDPLKALDASDNGLDRSLDEFQAARDKYVGLPSSEAMTQDIAKSGSVDEAIAKMQAAAQGPSELLDSVTRARDNNDRRQAAGMADMIDRQTELAAQQKAATTPFDQQNSLEQAATHLGLNTDPQTGETAAGHADLSPMDQRTAQGRLKVLRDQYALEGKDASGLAVAPHPNVEGRFAIADRGSQMPDLDLPRPPGPTPETAQARIESAALAGTDSARAAQDQPRQQVVDQIKRNIEARRGVASPEEAQALAEAGAGKPYDRVDPNLSTNPRIEAGQVGQDQRLQQATGIIPGEGGNAPKSRTAFSKNEEPAQVAAEQQARSDSRMGELAKDRQVAQQASDAQAAAAAAPSLKADDVIAAFRAPEPTASQRVTIDQARSQYTPEDLKILQAAGKGPFALNGAERTRLRELKLSEAREEPKEASSMGTPLSQERSDQLRNAPKTDLSTLPDQSKAKPGELSKQHHRFLKMLASVFGKKLNVFDWHNEHGPDGFYDPLKPNEINLNRNAQMSHLVVRSEERRVGKECLRLCRSRWSPYH